MKIKTISLFSLLDFNQLLQNELPPNVGVGVFFSELKKKNLCAINDEMDTQWKWKGHKVKIVNRKQVAY